MEYLSLSEIQSRSEQVKQELETLLATKSLAGKPRSRQWRFLRDAVTRLLSPDALSEFDGLSPVEAAQLKFEVEDKLSHFYRRPGKSVDHVFTLVHKSSLGRYFAGGEQYPDLAGYAVLIRDLTREHIGTRLDSPEDLDTYLERVVAESIDAEFRAYMALPEINQEELNRWFCNNSPAMKEILNVLTRHREKRWIISNPMNPSTKRLLSIKVKKTEDHEAVVSTMEYWYLRWWDDNRGEYAYPYRETNRQLYILRKEPDGWKLFQNLRPVPRSSIPHRWRRRQRT